MLNADVNAPIEKHDGLNIFEVALKEPKMSEFIEVCILYDAKLYQVCITNTTTLPYTY